MLHRSSLWLAASIATALLPLAADAQLTKEGSSEVAFTATGPAGVSIRGKTSELAVTGTDTVVVTVPVKTFETGIGIRDKHMREDLEADKYPAAQLTVQRKALQFPGAGQGAEADAEGTLTLHGQTNKISFHYVVQRSGSTFSVKGSTKIQMPDFGVHPRSYLGITVKDKVEVQASFNVVEK
jgi:polyisoprenoid-binding protein YceI